MYVLEQQIEREQFPPETEQKYLSYIKEHAGAALRRVHRQGNPDRVPGKLFGVRPEHLRPLRDVCRLLDPGPGVPRPGHRREFRPRLAERRAGKDREACGHQQPEGLPQRDRQLRAARARGEWRQEPGVDQLRKIPHRDREEDVLEHRGAAAGHRFNAKSSADDANKHDDFVDRMVEKGYTAKQVRLLCEWYLRVRKSS